MVQLAKPFFRQRLIEVASVDTPANFDVVPLQASAAPTELDPSLISLADVSNAAPLLASAAPVDVVSPSGPTVP